MSNHPEGRYAQVPNSCLQQETAQQAVIKLQTQQVTQLRNTNFPNSYRHGNDM